MQDFLSLACIGPCGLMDKALVFGTKDCRFESCQGHYSRVLRAPIRLALTSLSEPNSAHHNYIGTNAGNLCRLASGVLHERAPHFAPPLAQAQLLRPACSLELPYYVARKLCLKFAFVVPRGFPW